VVHRRTSNYVGNRVGKRIQFALVHTTSDIAPLLLLPAASRAKQQRIRKEHCPIDKQPYQTIYFRRAESQPHIVEGDVSQSASLRFILCGGDHFRDGICAGHRAVGQLFSDS